MNTALRAKLQAALGDRNVRAFLAVIREGETSQSDNAYRTMFGGGLIESLADHPRKAVTKQLGRQKITSTAAGAYQFLQRTWDECVDALGLPNFGHQSQDLAAVFLINRRSALEDVIAGRLNNAIAKCNREWASLPGSPYGQPFMTWDRALAVFQRAGGFVDFGSDRSKTTPAAPAPTKEATAMPFPAFLAAALPALIEAAPKLGRIFSSGSETAERNLKAAEMVVDIAKEAIGAKNEQELVEVIKTDPVAAQTVREAIEANWGRIDEMGGGIQAARDANVSQSAISPKRNMALWITVMLLPLVYMTVGSVIWSDNWSPDVRAMVVASIVTGLLGGITGYWLGTSFSSARKDEQRAGMTAP